MNILRNIIKQKNIGLAKSEIKRIIKNEITDEGGATMVEYALIVALIAVLLIGVISLMTGSISDLFTHIKDKITEAIK